MAKTTSAKHATLNYLNGFLDVIIWMSFITSGFSNMKTNTKAAFLFGFVVKS
jgi:hypothetical protein